MKKIFFINTLKKTLDEHKVKYIMEVDRPNKYIYLTVKFNDGTNTQGYTTVSFNYIKTIENFNEVVNRILRTYGYN